MIITAPLRAGIIDNAVATILVTQRVDDEITTALGAKIVLGRSATSIAVICGSINTRSVGKNAAGGSGQGQDKGG